MSTSAKTCPRRRVVLPLSLLVAVVAYSLPFAFSPFTHISEASRVAITLPAPFPPVHNGFQTMYPQAQLNEKVPPLSKNDKE